MDPIGPATRVGDLLDRWPGIVEVFAAFHLGSSRGAHLPRGDSLARLAADRGIDETMLVEAMRAWAEENGR